ncbi:hypothetical protein MPTK1_6g14260 [Marchantia polymorpha subsp. ruderalis]|uniref:Uncharacterized protein n=2 Tax=Marchantia polymorpha TaxID=3197 RepID=A0AAF6BRX3_MARPO|nr:hypothetical protein MARPO_0047s0080 [Marchantia polymorpha]BBN14757.1 hypothetical protein Mp_6g14260 [Marchantia polymorpha subsp. ruderalis]PTQ39101.1 hypothetical protein MARPO_0047s0080 [Marchantia polymorpha]PTQ39102.1 hypothetical protein MARPO_0047s0080 [Marchantia polymorpha]BBN14758.1 hypothetical protein Mp_6g14260 [Marchantia polymorpha subsp. ruderalis]|eukprot:PTQ39100.1 hypothetical protein MARPO_0047s0080 [Marchantia polymorpha]
MGAARRKSRGASSRPVRCTSLLRDSSWTEDSRAVVMAPPTSIGDDPAADVDNSVALQKMKVRLKKMKLRMKKCERRLKKVEKRLIPVEWNEEVGSLFY